MRGARTTLSAVSTMSELQKTKAHLEAEQAKIIERIQAIRLAARDESLRAQQTREPLPGH
jgi:hypothetical protein